MAIGVTATLLIRGATAQEAPPQIVSRTESRDAWGVDRLADLRFGRVALVAAPEGVRLDVRRLRETPVPIPPVSMEGRAPTGAGNIFVVSNFGESNRTPLGGYFGTFQRDPSRAEARVDRMADGRRALELICRVEGTGFCGLWIQLYDFEAAPEARRYLDARGFSTLSFWIRGRAGGEPLLLKAADAVWEQREDALPVGDVAAFLPTGRVDTTWQQAVIPLERLPVRLRREALAMLVFEATAPGTSTIELGPVALSVAPRDLPSLPDPQLAVEPTSVGHKATWVWNTAELLADSLKRSTMLAFLEREGFDRVFLQLPGVPDAPNVPGELAIDTPTMRSLVADFTRRGMRVYALDGYARYALPEFHAGVLATIDHVIRYNDEVSPHEQFFGVRYDIEPYLLPAFHGSGRATLLRGLLELTAASVERAHAAGLVYGADIPFWYDATSDDTPEAVTVEYRGIRQPVSAHLIDLVDDVAIMDYRTTAYGADGTIRHASGELAYASRRGKPVLIALETFDLPDEVLLEVHGAPRRGLPSRASTQAVVAVVTAGDSLLVVYVKAAAGADTAVADWLAERGLDAMDVWWWPVSRRVEVPAAKLTFARHDLRHLNDVVRGTAAELRRYPSFAGFALHSAASYMALVERGAPPR